MMLYVTNWEQTESNCPSSQQSNYNESHGRSTIYVNQVCKEYVTPNQTHGTMPVECMSTSTKAHENQSHRKATMASKVKCQNASHSVVPLNVTK